MRHRESEVPLEEIKTEVKNEFNIDDIKDEDLEVFGLEIPLDVPLDSEYEKVPNATSEFCDNEHSLLDENFVPSSPSNLPLSRSRRKAYQPQRAKSHKLPLATFPSNNNEDTNNLEDYCDEDEFKDIEQELEEEMASNDEDEVEVMQGIPNVPDTEEQTSQISNDIFYNDVIEGAQSSTTDTQSEGAVQELQEEAVGGNEELVSQKSVEEEWKLHWGVKCNLCSNAVFPEKAQFDDHYKTLHKLKPVYTCSYCDKTMNTYSTFRSHCYRHTSQGRYKCNACTKSFNLRSILEMHKKSRHTDKKPYTCEICQKGFLTLNGLSHHVENHGSNRKRKVFNCGDCGKVLMTRGGIVAHNIVHQLGRRFMCDMCGKTFTQKVNMQQHVKQHTGERPYKCEQCGKSFAEKSHLSRHSSFHSDERPFQCNICKKMYKTERCLKVHKQVHAPNRPHVCELCHKGFLSSTKLRQHFNIHTGERPYKCQYCGRTFTNYPNWLKHVRRRHKVHHKTGVSLEPKQEVPQPLTPQVQPDVMEDMANSILILPQQLDTTTYIDPLFVTDPSVLTTALELNEDTKYAQTLNEDSKMNIQTNLLTQYETGPSTSYANMSFMLPFQQNNVNILEPHPAHQQQMVFQPMHNLEEPHPAHQQVVFADGMHFLHPQQMLHM